MSHRVRHSRVVYEDIIMLGMDIRVRVNNIVLMSHSRRRCVVIYTVWFKELSWDSWYCLRGLSL